MMSSDIEKMITPAFQFGAINENVLLAEDKIEIQVDGTAYKGNGQAWLELIPRPHIIMYCEFEGIPLNIALPVGFKQKPIDSFTFGNKAIDGFIISIGGDAPKEEFNLRWCPRSEPIIGRGDETTEIQNIIFHLFNFKDVFGLESIELKAEPWIVELRSLLETSDRFKQLKENGGYGLTHIGILKKTDESLFSGKEAADALHALRFFFSFAKGNWCNPICPVGFDDANNHAWELWSSPKDPWQPGQTPFSWFDPHHSQQLVSLFPGFMSKWNNEDWREALHEVIYWYLNSNHSLRGIDAGIILTQAAIERLSYEYAVKDRKLIEANGFKNLRASDKFRLLFSSLDIPIDIPTSLSEMTKFAGQFNWLDSPHALTEMRNSLVHPEHKRRGQYSDAYFEAWNLGLWYLELALLRICGYVGSYCNRLNARWVGTIEDVPWQQ